MSVFRVPKRGNYTIMSNIHLRDPNLSLKAKGMLSYMLSNPDDWDYSVKGLARFSSDGIDSVRSGLKELMEHKYLIRVKVRDAKGHIVDYDYQIFEAPIGSQETSPPSETPCLDFPIAGNPTLPNTEQSNH